MDKTNKLTGVAKAEVIERIVAENIAGKAWRATALNEALAYATKTERKLVEAYVRAQYDAAGAGFSGRWQ